MYLAKKKKIEEKSLLNGKIGIRKNETHLTFFEFMSDYKQKVREI